MDGCIYRTKDGECDLYAEGGKYHAFCVGDAPCDGRKQSNADRIRQMSDEELARFVAKARADILRTVGRALKYPGDLVRDCDLEDAADDWLEWLKQEVESDG